MDIIEDKGWYVITKNGSMDKDIYPTICRLFESYSHCRTLNDFNRFDDVKLSIDLAGFSKGTIIETVDIYLDINQLNLYDFYNEKDKEEYDELMKKHDELWGNYKKLPYKCSNKELSDKLRKEMESLHEHIITDFSFDLFSKNSI